MSIMSELYEERETEVREDGAFLGTPRRSRGFQDDFASESDMRDGYVRYRSDAAKFDFSKPADSSKKEEARDRTELQYKESQHTAERSDKRMERLMKKIHEEFSAPYIGAQQAAEYGLTPERMQEMGMHPDGTPFESGPAVSDPGFTDADALQAYADEIDASDADLEQSPEFSG